MNGENENGKHDLNFFLDKQLQQKLLEADDHFLERDYVSNHIASYLVSNKLKSNGNNSNQSNASQVKQTPNTNNLGNGIVRTTQKALKFLHSVHVCGWCPDPTVHYRKSDNDVIPRSRGGMGVARESVFSRDSKSRPHNLNNFVFRHYADPRKYIEQYRREHICYDTTNSSATKSEFLDSRRFYAYNQYSPLAVGSHGASYQSNNYIPQPQQEMHSSEPQQKTHNQTPVLHYSNRREQQRQIISASMRAKSQHQYKMSKASNSKSENLLAQDYTEEYIEALEISNNNKQRRTGSAKDRSSPGINGTSIQKLGATKVNVPAGASGSRSVRQPSSGSTPEVSSVGHFHSHKLGPLGSGMRTLDSLSCVVNTPLDKQSQVQSAADKDSSSNKQKNDTVLLPRKKNNSSNTSVITSTTVTASNPHSSKGHKTSVVSVYQSASSSHKNAEKMDENPMLNGSIHCQNEDKDVDVCLSSGSSAVSIGCLSTKCLGVEATVKSQPKLEASCTYHVFPNELTLSQHAGYIPPLLWNPSKSALERRPQAADIGSMEFGLPSPFRQSPRTRPRTEESRNNRVVEFITKEFVTDTKPINLCSDTYKETPRIATTPGLKTNTIKPDLPPTFALQGFSKRPHFESFGKKRGLSKTAMSRRKKENRGERENERRKSRSASTDTSNHSTSGNAMKLKPVTGDTNSSSNDNNNNNNSNLSATLAPVPYFKFWNSSLPPKSRDRRRVGVEKTCELTMQQLAEMVLADESGKRDQELKEAAKKVLEQHTRSEVEQKSSAGIATGGTWVAPSFNRITQDKLLESLCRINQRPNDPIPFALPLTLVQEDSSQDVSQELLAQQLHGSVSQNNSMNNSNKNLTRINFSNPNQTGPCKPLPNHGNLEVISNPIPSAKNEVLVFDKKKERKRQRELSYDECINYSDSSQPTTNYVRTKIKSKSQEWQKPGHVKPLHFLKNIDDHSTSHQRKIKRLIEQSQLKNRFGQHVQLSPKAVPDISVGVNAFDPEISMTSTGCFGLFPENESENPFLKITHCSTLVPDCVFGSKLLSESDVECSQKETSRLKQKSGSNKVSHKKTSVIDKGVEVPPSLSTVEDFINSLQTNGPSIPPLCGTGLGNQLTDKSERKSLGPKKEKFTPLSHPDLEKLARRLSVKVRVSHMKYSKADHIERSQTIHL